MQFEESKSQLIPAKEGVKCKLDRLPYIKEFESTGGKAIVWEFVNDKEEYFSGLASDPFGQVEPDKAKAAGSRQLHMFGAFMTAENYNEFKSSKFESLEDVLEKGLQYMAEDATSIDCKILIGYNKKGFTSFPARGDVISTKYKPKTLLHNPKSNLTLEVKEDNGYIAPDSEDMMR